jgi:succinate dehydrogenase/fumarate reductase flavoprotein subunit
MAKEFDFDVIVLGAGGAGCAAAITAARNGTSVALISKEGIGMGNTRMSGGEVSSSGVVEGDSPEVLKRDMMKGGEYLSNRDLVDVIARNASSAIRFVQSLGHYFRRDQEGRFSAKAASRLGGHSFPRSFGGLAASIAHALRNAVANTKSISVFEDTLVVSLLREGDEIRGALGVDLKTSECVVLKAKATVLATGGCGWLYYPQTTNNRTATGDGYAIAFEAGVQLVDMEMVQFFPFAMNHPPHLAGTLLDEPILAGPKGKLINGLGEVFADHDINTMTRAQVTALMAKEISAGKATEWGGLKLDLSGNLDVPEMLEFKRVKDEVNFFEKVRIAYGEKAFNWEEPWDVSPSAHYMMGGVKIDPGMRSSMKNLYAIGESAGGAMGANRLGSTSITDIFVTGMIAGKEASTSVKGQKTKVIKKSLISKEVKKMEELFGQKGKRRPIELKREIQRLMRENVGVVRDEERVSSALSHIDRMEEEVEKHLSVSSIRRYNTEFLDAIELKYMLTCARMIATCAGERKESRGAHLRLEYPDKDDTHWLQNIVIQKKDGGIETSFSQIEPIEDEAR